MEGAFALSGNGGATGRIPHSTIVEAASLVNNTPIWYLPDHPNDPLPLSPAVLLTLRDYTNPAPPEVYGEKDALNYASKRYHGHTISQNSSGEAGERNTYWPSLDARNGRSKRDASRSVTLFFYETADCKEIIGQWVELFRSRSEVTIWCSLSNSRRPLVVPDHSGHTSLNLCCSYLTKIITVSITLQVIQKPGVLVPSEYGSNI